MADRSKYKLKRSSKRSRDAAFSVSGLLYFAFAIGLLSLCSGCHLSGEKPGSIKFLQPDALHATPPMPKKFANRTGFNRQATKSLQNPLVASADYPQTKKRFVEAEAKRWFGQLPSRR